MGREIWVRDGTGVTCAICHEKILKSQRQINFRGWNASGAVHSEPEDCDKELRQDIDLSALNVKVTEENVYKLFEEAKTVHRVKQIFQSGGRRIGKIGAIKAYRRIMDTGLKESLDEVNTW